MTLQRLIIYSCSKLVISVTEHLVEVVDKLSTTAVVFFIYFVHIFFIYSVHAVLEFKLFIDKQTGWESPLSHGTSILCLLAGDSLLIDKAENSSLLLHWVRKCLTLAVAVPYLK